jgi:hypothetical protein
VLALGLLAACVLTASSASAQAEDAALSSGFQFILAFDPDYFEFTDAQRGEFLGSTGRDVQCEEPQVDVGAVLLICVTLGAEPEGATGDGTLFSIMLTPRAAGETTLGLTRAVLSTPPGDEIPNTTTGIAVEVEGASSGINWAIWGPIIGGALLLILICAVVTVVLMRRGSTRSAAPDYGSSNSS